MAVCGECQASMILIVMVHHSCASVVKPLFTADLHMHLCFAVFAAQVYCSSVTNLQN